MAEKHNPKDINKKLRSLTPEQSKALAANLNSVYTNAEKARKKTAKSTQKKSGK